MEDIDITIYASIVMILFIFFGEFRRMNGNEYTGYERTDDTKLFKSFMGKAFG